MKLSKIFKAPEKTGSSGRKSVFLAGSIEMDKAEDWQAKVSTALQDMEIDIYNPRRENWDASWEQSIEDKNFRTQVEWELDHLDKATAIFMYFDKKTKSPISLLELGLYATGGKLVVVCPDEFWRKGNVEVTCKRYNIPLFDNIEDGIKKLKTKLS